MRSIGKHKIINFRVPMWLHDRLVKTAGKNKMTVSEYLRDLLIKTFK